MFPLSKSDQMKGIENLRKDWRKYNEELVVRGIFYLDFILWKIAKKTSNDE